VRTESRERAAVQAGAARFLDDLCGWPAISSIGADPEYHGEVARSARWPADVLRRDGWPTVQVWSGDGLGGEVLFSLEGCSGPEAEVAETPGVPVSFLGVGLPDDRIHAPNERVTLPLLHRGAEAAVHLWRLLGSQAR